MPENPIIHKDHFMNKYPHRVVQRQLPKHHPLSVLPAEGRPLAKGEKEAVIQVYKDPKAASDELMGTFGPDPVSTSCVFQRFSKDPVSTSCIFQRFSKDPVSTSCVFQRFSKPLKNL